VKEVFYQTGISKYSNSSWVEVRDYNIV